MPETSRFLGMSRREALSLFIGPRILGEAQMSLESRDDPRHIVADLE